jgi:hypothetical protein
LQQESKSVEEIENKNPRSNVCDKRKVRSDIGDEQSPAKRKKDASRKLNKPPKDNIYQVQNSSQLTKVEGTNQKNNKSDVNRSEQQLTRGKLRAYSDQCTAFISNLHPTVNRALSLSLPLVCGCLRQKDTNELCYCRQMMSIFVISSVISVELLPSAFYMTSSPESPGY